MYSFQSQIMLWPCCAALCHAVMFHAMPGIVHLPDVTQRPCQHAKAACYSDLLKHFSGQLISRLTHMHMHKTACLSAADDSAASRKAGFGYLHVLPAVMYQLRYLQGILLPDA